MIVTIDGIPVYQALVSDKDTGMFKISLVDDPAVEKDFLKFDSNRRPLLYAVQDEEKRLVRGVVMRADFPIYRRDDTLGEYYVIYKAETIRTMAEKYLLESRQNDVDLMHVAESDVDGVQMVQFFIKDSVAGVSPEGFEDIADGSLFAEFHVVNDEVWDEIKAGTYKGFSLEGVFDLAPERDRDEIEEIVRLLGDGFRKFFKNNDMSKINRFKAALQKALLEFGTITTDKGVLSWDGDDDLKAGDRVYVLDAEGNRNDGAEDGDYTTEDGKVIRVAGGEVSEIIDPEAEVGDEFQKVSTDNGELEWDGTEDLKEGDAVFITDEAGERSAAPDGDYATEDGKVIRVANGVVTEIVDPVAEVAPQDLRRESRFERICAAFSESYEEKVKKIYDAIVAAGYTDYGFIWEAGEDYAVYFYITEDEGEHFVRFVVSWAEDGSAVVSDPTEVKQEFVPTGEPAAEPEPDPAVEELRRENDELRSQLDELKKKPMAQRAHDEVITASRMEKTGIKRLDNLGRFFK